LTDESCAELEPPSEVWFADPLFGPPPAGIPTRCVYLTVETPVKIALETIDGNLHIQIHAQ
jgi:hypothetical protein